MAKARVDKVLYRGETHVTIARWWGQVVDVPIWQHKLVEQFHRDPAQFRRDRMFQLNDGSEDSERIKAEFRSRLGLDLPSSFGAGPLYAPGLMVHYLPVNGYKYWVFDSARQFVCACNSIDDVEVLLEAEATSMDPDRKYLRLGARTFANPAAEREAFEREAVYNERDKVETAKFRADMAQRDNAKAGKKLSLAELNALLGI